MRWPLLIVVSIGCVENALDPVHQGDPPEWALVSDTFVQAPLPEVDLLFVIDDTASMAQEQEALAEQFFLLATLLSAQGVLWQSGVVTTDMTSPTAGWLRGDPWILTPDRADLVPAFTDAMRVGTGGARPEAGLAAAQRALDLTDPGEPNAGFRRHDAGLHVIFVSDTDDASDTWLGADPVAEFGAWLALEASNGLPATASAVVGDLPGGCTSTLGTATAAPRYHQVVGSAGGAVVSICDADLAPLIATLGAATLAYPTRFTLRARPIDGSLRVSVDGARRTTGWALDAPAAPLPSVLVFDVPPAPGAEIVASYVVEVGL